MADSKKPRKPRTIRPLPNQAEFDRLMERAAKVNGMSKNFFVDFIRQMEWTRLGKRFTQSQMADVIGIEKTSYTRALGRVSEAADNKTVFIWLSCFVQYCYIFGYDIQSMTGLKQATKELDSDIVSLAHLISGFDRHTITVIRDAVKDSDMAVNNKRSAVALIDKIMDDKSKFDEEVSSDETFPSVTANGSANANADDADAKIAKARAAGKKSTKNATAETQSEIPDAAKSEG